MQNSILMVIYMMILFSSTEMQAVSGKGGYLGGSGINREPRSQEDREKLRRRLNKKLTCA